MKKIILFVFLVIIALGTFSISAYSQSQTENPAVPANKKNRVSIEETRNLPKRTEVKGTDPSNQVVVVQEGRRSRRGYGEMNGNHRNHGGVIFIGGGSLLLLIILIIILV